MRALIRGPRRVRLTARREVLGRRTILRAAAVLGAVATLAGCAQIPRQSAVKEVGSVSQQDNELGPVNFLPAGPQKGATPEQILNGFVQAAVSPTGDFQVAREFLTPQFGAKWNPDASVTVDTGSRDYSDGGDAHRTMSITPVGFVDADGTYQSAESATPIQQNYSFAKVGGQWRISSAPNGVVIDTSRFGSVFSPHSLYFYNSGDQFLVPDQRWFPNAPASLQTRIVKELVQGPASWLGGAYTTAFPQGSQLSSDSVTVTNGVADVDLNSSAGSADPTALARMQWQLSQSLSSVAGISSVRISVEGVQRTPAVLPTPPVQDPAIDSNALVMAGGKFGLLSGSEVTDVPDISSKVVALSARAVTLSADRRTAAVLAPGGAYVVRADAVSPTVFDSRPGLVAPALDPSGYAWSASASDPDALVVQGPAGAPFALSAAWPDARSLIAIAMSRDGTRLAALVQTGSGVAIMVGGVLRDGQGKPTSVAAPVQIGRLSSGTPTSLTWLDDLTVAALTTGSDGTSTVEVQPIGGIGQTVAGPARGAALGAVGSSPNYWVLTSDGALDWPRGTAWQQRASGVQFIATQLGKPQ